MRLCCPPIQSIRLNASNPSEQVRSSEVHGGDAREATDVRRGLAEPQPVGVAGVPGAAHSVQGEEEGRQAGLAHRLPRKGVPRHARVLLGALPRRVQLR